MRHLRCHGVLNATRARAMLDEALDQHGLMISVALYRRIVEVLAPP